MGTCTYMYVHNSVHICTHGMYTYVHNTPTHVHVQYMN